MDEDTVAQPDAEMMDFAVRHHAHSQARALEQADAERRIAEKDLKKPRISSIAELCHFICSVSSGFSPTYMASYTLPSGRTLPLTPNEEPDVYALSNPQLDTDENSEFPPELVEEGMQQEMKSMRDFDVFEEVLEEQLTDEQRAEAITSRWVLTWKGSSVRARLVARGFEQVFTEVDDTYASTPVFTILRVLICFALALSWCIMTCLLYTSDAADE